MPGPWHWRARGWAIRTVPTRVEFGGRSRPDRAAPTPGSGCRNGGWWDGNPAHLKPAPAAELARELASLAGGAAALAARAEAIADPRLACELIELAYQAAPDDAAIRAARARLYAARAGSERSLMARGIFATAAAESRKEM